MLQPMMIKMASPKARSQSSSLEMEGAGSRRNTVGNDLPPFHRPLSLGVLLASLKFNLGVNKLKQETNLTKKLKTSDLGNLQKLTPDLARLRKLTPGLDDLKSMMTQDAEKLQKLSLAPKDIENRISGLEDINKSEIENLGDTAIATQISFERVSNALSDALNTVETPEQADNLSSFGENWCKYQLEWDKLPQVSQEVASRAWLAAADFMENLQDPG
ncbi:hypothetical protein EDD17DRAFT_1761838 [Pisolithus thermaeus]|nr:hypothetical protein EDD17DRAFT_1761838 [Pisolithus thermaeus]